MKKLKHFLSVLLFLSLVFSSVYSEQSYIITESELLQLEKNTQEQETQIETLKTEYQNLMMLQNQMKTYCEQLEKEKKIIKSVSIVGGCLFFVGGCFVGYKIAKE